MIPPITFAEPAISFAIEPKTRADEDRISRASQRLVEEGSDHPLRARSRHQPGS